MFIRLFYSLVWVRLTKEERKKPAVSFWFSWLAERSAKTVFNQRETDQVLAQVCSWSCVRHLVCLLSNRARLLINVKPTFGYLMNDFISTKRLIFWNKSLSFFGGYNGNSTWLSMDTPRMQLLQPSIVSVLVYFKPWNSLVVQLELDTH